MPFCFKLYEFEVTHIIHCQVMRNPIQRMTQAPLLHEKKIYEYIKISYARQYHISTMEQCDLLCHQIHDTKADEGNPLNHLGDKFLCYTVCNQVQINVDIY